LIGLLNSQNKTLLNVDEIKRKYLQDLRIEKSANSITTKQYYSSVENQDNKSSTQTTQRS
jgi:hypothetical protein